MYASYMHAAGKGKKVKFAGNVDVFLAAVVNQKAVNQNAQQALVLIAAQILNIIEAQFGVATNEDQDEIGE